MKKIILGLTIGLLLISCSSSSNDSASSSGIYKWKFKLDGVLYEWQGNHLAPNGGGAFGAGGQATYAVNSLALQKANANGTIPVTVSVTFPTTSTGNFVFNSSTSSTSQNVNIIFTSDNQQLTGQYSTMFGGNMNVNITSLSNTTFASNPTNPGKVIGTFSGTINSASGTSSTITEGSFEAVRGQ